MVCFLCLNRMCSAVCGDSLNVSRLVSSQSCPQGGVRVSIHDLRGIPCRVIFRHGQELILILVNLSSKVQVSVGRKSRDGPVQGGYACAGSPLLSHHRRLATLASPGWSNLFLCCPVKYSPFIALYPFSTQPPLPPYALVSRLFFVPSQTKLQP